MALVVAVVWILGLVVVVAMSRAAAAGDAIEVVDEDPVAARPVAREDGERHTREPVRERSSG